MRDLSFETPLTTHLPHELVHIFSVFEHNDLDVVFNHLILDRSKFFVVNYMIICFEWTLARSSLAYAEFELTQVLWTFPSCYFDPIHVVFLQREEDCAYRLKIILKCLSKFPESLGNSRVRKDCLSSWDTFDLTFDDAVVKWWHSRILIVMIRDRHGSFLLNFCNWEQQFLL